jgi:hypothetical protein
MVSSCTAVLSGSSVSDTVFLSLNPATGNLEFGYNGAETITLTGSALCALVPGSINYTGPVALYTPLTVTASNWPLTAVPAYGISPNTIAPGPGLASAQNPINGTQTISTDPSVTPRYFVGSGAPAIGCTAGRDFYTDTTAFAQYFCKAANVWLASGGGSGGTDSSYRYIPTASGIINYGSSLPQIGAGWTWDGIAASAIENSVNQMAGLRIANATGAHYAYTIVTVPVGWTGTVNLRSHHILTVATSGTGTGTHTYSVSCIVPGTTVMYGAAPTFSGASAVGFNITTAGLSTVDTYSYSGLTCNPGTLGSPTGAMMLIRIVRASTGTATDDTILLGFEVSLPHTVQ